MLINNHDLVQKENNKQKRYQLGFKLPQLYSV